MPSQIPRSPHPPVIAALLVALVALWLPSSAIAKDAPIPERFTTLQSETDLPGGDLRPGFSWTSRFGTHLATTSTAPNGNRQAISRPRPERTGSS